MRVVLIRAPPLFPRPSRSTVNGHGSPPAAFNPLQPAALGPCPPAAGDPTRRAGEFTSEFGVGQPASFENMAPTLSPPFWGMHGGAHPPDNCSGGFAHTCTGGNVMAQRNYGCDDAWASYFPPGSNLSVSLGDSGADAFRAQTFLCQLITALQLRALVQQERSVNKFGLLTWQLGEMWPTYVSSLSPHTRFTRAHARPSRTPGPPPSALDRYGWGSLEYSSGPGSVLGGRWKPSHYFLKRAYASFFAAAGDDGRVLVKNDDPLAGYNGTLTLALVHLGSGAVTPLGAPRALALPRGAGALDFLCVDPAAPPPCAAPAAAAAAAANCSSATPNTDVQGTGGSSVPAADAAACCAACGASPACARAVLFQGNCWLKEAGGTVVPKAGATLVVPSNRAPACPALGDVLARSGCARGGTDCLLLVNGEAQLLAPPGALALAQGVRVALAVGAGGGAGDAAPIAVELRAEGGGGGPALFATLFTQAQGRFSDNAVPVGVGAPVTLFFIPFAEGQGDALRDTLRVEFLNK